MKSKPIGIVFAANMHRGHIIADHVTKQWFRPAAVIILTPRSIYRGRGRGCTAIDNVWWDVAVRSDPHTMHIGNDTVDDYIKSITGGRPRYEYVNIEVLA